MIFQIPTSLSLPTLGTLNPAYAPLPDGKGVLTTIRVDTSQSHVANVVLNWQALREGGISGRFCLEDLGQALATSPMNAATTIRKRE